MAEQVLVLPDDTHNRTLISNVHPSDWVNPEPAGRYNLVVVGAGTAGLITAAGAAALGARVALVEKRLMGGDCLNVGCVPSKGLLRAARACADVRDAGDFGVCVPSGVRVDFPAAMERMRRLRARISRNDSAARYRDMGVDVFLGEGRFTGRGAAEVDGKRLRFRKAVIATGARPAAAPVPGIEEAGYLTNETVFWLTELPRRLAVIGAGPIGCELSQAFARFGAEVFLIQRREQILIREDRDAAERVEKALVRDGVRLLLGTKTLQVRKEGDEKILRIEREGGQTDLRVDEILVGAGRAPNVQGLNLEAVGVEYDERSGVRVNDRLQTTNSQIYAAGDVCSRYQFTHLADALARIVIQNALFLGRAKVSALTLPWCTYTDPEIAHVGLSEEQAEEQGLPVQIFRLELSDVDRAVLDGEEGGFLKLLVKKGSDRVIGATLVARHAGEMISEITLAMTAGIGLRKISRTIHPYPTQAEVLRKAGDAYNRTRLTPAVKTLLRKWLAWSR
ncbi:MAG: mercuric reductase [Nitrospinota bacterium]